MIEKDWYFDYLQRTFKYIENETVLDYTIDKDVWIRLSLKYNKPLALANLLNQLNVPNADVSLQERVSYYRLFLEEKKYE